MKYGNVKQTMELKPVFNSVLSSPVIVTAILLLRYVAVVNRNFGRGFIDVGRTLGRTFLNSLMEARKSDEGLSRAAYGPMTWSEWEDCGFPDRVNHATTALTDSNGRRRVYAMGGFAGRGHAVSGEERWNDLGEVALDVLELDVGTFKVFIV